jgi:predicted nucleic acid-binding protein
MGAPPMKRLTHCKVYLDTNIFIYAVEGFELFMPRISQLFEMIDTKVVFATTSELTLAECLVMPYRKNRLDIAAVYEDILKGSDTLRVKAINRDILTAAAMIRAKGQAMKLPDAIHMATAASAKCDLFLTNDKNIKSKSISVLHLDALT